VRRNGLLVGGWTLATLLALVLGLQGIHSVSTSVTNTRPAPLSPASVKAALQRTNAASSSSASSASAAASSADQSAGTVPSSDSGSEDHGAGDDSGSVGLVPPASSDGTPRQATPPDSTTSSSSDNRVASSSSSSDATDSSSSSTASPRSFEDKTYQLVGGSVGVRFANGGARLLWANPNNGYRVETSSEGGQVEVQFDNGQHESRLQAWWDNGPQQQIEEGPSGSD
jgi:hypothetical protein